ncbi:MAG: hypothetical protein ABF649_16100 [Bacillus sp. (in: firmicutes)]
MNKEKSKTNECTFEEKGTEEVIAQVMDVYNDGAIDQAIQNNEVEGEKRG